MKTKKLAIIHTGFHKTGSSSIQHSLAKNRELLDESGYYYPEVRPNSVVFYNKSVPLFGRYSDKPDEFPHYWYHNKLSADFANAEIEKLFSSNLWQREKLIFSDEFISVLSPAGLARLRDDFRTHGYRLRVVSYIREPFSHLVSVAQQLARLDSLSSTLTSNRPDEEVKKVLDLIEIFGADAEFYSFEKACRHAAGPVGFFFELLGIDLPKEKTVKVNEGMSAPSVRLLSFINSVSPQLADSKRVNPIRKPFDVAPLSKIPGDQFRLTVDEVSLVKPKIERARKELSEILGDEFLPSAVYSQCGGLVWSTDQFDYLIEIKNKLDLHLLLRVHDFLGGLNLEEESELNLRNELSHYIRDRLDAELKHQSSVLVKSIDN